MYTEFLAAALAAQSNIEEERIAEAFDRLDADDSGYISRQNLREFLGGDNSYSDVESIIRKADVDKDGKISWDEFLQLFRQQHTKRMSAIQHMESTATESDANLIGLDAKIPGGKFDSTVSSS